MNLRQMAVAGQFYPDNCEQINQWFMHFKSAPNIQKNFEPKALIVPHAGYMYSGNCAYKAYAQADLSIKHVVVVGPSHRVGFDGASIGRFKELQTPCGAITCNNSIQEHLLDRLPWLNFTPQAHNEHSTEVQFPFIKEFFPDASATEIVYSSISSTLLKNLLKVCAYLPETLLIISTDLSHFYSLEDAKRLDSACIRAIKDLYVKELEDGEACGMIGIGALILLARELGWKSQVLEYCTSFEQTGDRNQVVGYLSAILG